MPSENDTLAARFGHWLHGDTTIAGWETSPRAEDRLADGPPHFDADGNRVDRRVGEDL